MQNIEKQKFYGAVPQQRINVREHGMDGKGLGNGMYFPMVTR